MDRQSVYSSHVYNPTFEQGEDTNLQVQAQLEAFILDFRLDNVFVYRCAPYDSLSTRLGLTKCQRSTARERSPQEILL